MKAPEADRREARRHRRPKELCGSRRRLPPGAQRAPARLLPHGCPRPRAPSGGPAARELGTDAPSSSGRAPWPAPRGRRCHRPPLPRPPPGAPGPAALQAPARPRGATRTPAPSRLVAVTYPPAPPPRAGPLAWGKGEEQPGGTTNGLARALRASRPPGPIPAPSQSNRGGGLRGPRRRGTARPLSPWAPTAPPAQLVSPTEPCGSRRR